MDKLPKDIIIQIMKKLRTPDIASFSSTCKKYSVICSDDSRYNSFWQWKLKEDYKTIYQSDSDFKRYKWYNKIRLRFYGVSYCRTERILK